MKAAKLKVLKAEAIGQIKAHQGNSDFEAAHVAADNVLCDFLRKIGHGDLVDEFDKVGKWYA